MGGYVEHLGLSKWWRGGERGRRQDAAAAAATAVAARVFPASDHRPLTRARARVCVGPGFAWAAAAALGAFVRVWKVPPRFLPCRAIRMVVQ